MFLTGTFSSHAGSNKTVTSGGDVIGKTNTLSVSGSGYQETFHPAVGSDTSLSYNAAGAPTGKSYAAGAGENYGYAGGLLESITLARGGELTFGYSNDGAKDLTSASWPTVASGAFTIPAVSQGYGYDRAGRLDGITDASGSRSLAYQNGRLQQTTWNSGALAGYRVARTLDGSGRDTGFILYRGNSIIHSVGKTPNSDSGEISSLASGAFKVVPQRDDAGNITGFQWGNASGSFAPVVTQSWDRGTAGRILSASSNVTGAPAFNYKGTANDEASAFDTKGRRLKCATAGGEWAYQYTNGMLTSAAHPSLGTFSYQFDGIGRRTDKGSTNSTDLLNRTLAWTNSQTKTLKVFAHPDAHVWVGMNGAADTQIQGFTGEASYAITPPDSTGGWVPWHTLAVLPGAGEGNPADPHYNSHASPDAKAEQFGAVWVPPIAESFTYDAAGNRESSALWDYGWDAKNQLVRSRTKGYNTAVQGYDISFEYDAEGRRFGKEIIRYQNGAVAEQKQITFVWDGWDLLYERHQLTSGLTTLERKYVWGPDIAGGGAGGAGGLLLIRETKGTTTTDIYPLYDGTGHVVALADSSGTLQAEYAYGPFGELLHATGPMAQANPWRYATKYFDAETGLYYFGRRYLDPITGQWLSREPLGESESINLYAYCHNDPINSVDLLGMWQINTQEEANIQRAKWLLMMVSEVNKSPIAPPSQFAPYFPEAGDFGLFKPFGPDDYKRAEELIRNQGNSSMRVASWEEGELAGQPVMKPGLMPDVAVRALTLSASPDPNLAAGYATIVLPVGAGGFLLNGAVKVAQISKLLATGMSLGRPALAGINVEVRTGTLLAAKGGTQLSVDDKLARYLLNPEHPIGGAKAKWFDEALGFTRSNADDLAGQLTFDAAKAVQQEVAEFGTKFNQLIEVVGANGRTIPVKVTWIRNNDGVVRIVTAVPGD